MKARNIRQTEILITTVLLMLILFVSYADAVEVDILNENLEAAIPEGLGIQTGVITEMDLDRLTYLHAGDNIIADLTGSEYYPNLAFLFLDINHINDNSRPSGLKKLHELNLSDHHVNEIRVLDTNNLSVLQFKSGFEPNTYILGDKIKGIDNSGPSGANSWDNLSDYFPWLLMGDGYFEGGSMEISTDPFNPVNHVLHLHTFQNEKGYARSQWSLEQVHNWYVEGGPNLFKQQFYRFRILIPERIKTLYSTSEQAGWYMIWESHTWDFEPTRHGIYLFKLANSDHWGFRVVQQSSINHEYLYENVPYYDVEVPIGQWFTMEIFFKYDETDGEFYAAIRRDGQPKQTIADFKGQTKFGTKLHDQMMFKLYHDGDYINRASALGLDGIHQYYDDFEIWSDYPGEKR